MFKKRINEKISPADFAKFIEIWRLLSSMNDPESFLFLHFLRQIRWIHLFFTYDKIKIQNLHINFAIRLKSVLKLNTSECL